jgi:hypothetical protein
MNLYDLYIKSVNFPSHNLELVESHLGGFHVNHPISKKNDNLGTLDITFKLSEDMLNYFYLYNWIKGLREGVNLDNEKWNRLNVIKEIKLMFLDNQKRSKKVYIFQNAFVTDLGSLSLTNGQDVELDFTISVTYEDFGIVDGEC